MTNNKEIDKIPVVLKKRGRKSKKELMEIEMSKLQQINNVNSVETQISLEINDSGEQDNVIIESSHDSLEKIDFLSTVHTELITNEKPLTKKRGRKPKGGKIIQQITTLNNNKEVKPNIILHLKCLLKDLLTDTNNADIQSYHFPNNNVLNYNVISDSLVTKNNEQNVVQYNLNNNEVINSIIKEKTEDCDIDVDDYNFNKEDNVKEIWKKLKLLEHNLHINNICDKKSACFWCTYEFDNPPVYIPKQYIKDSYQVYGCFCSPECATAFLMDENIDSSSKFERYHLMNHIYSKIYDYKKNIKPSPNPYYMLDKYYGNLTIQEYRSLLRNERLFLIVDKPLTRILPELHEDNDDFIINNKIIPSNTYHIKKKNPKKSIKNNILNEQFGLSQ
jgi:hypothetical protein